MTDLKVNFRREQVTQISAVANGGPQRFIMSSNNETPRTFPTITKTTHSSLPMYEREFQLKNVFCCVTATNSSLQSRCEHILTWFSPCSLPENSQSRKLKSTEKSMTTRQFLDIWELDLSSGLQNKIKLYWHYYTRICAQWETIWVRE